MLEFIQRLDHAVDADNQNLQQAATDTLTLPYELRVRGRLRAVTDKGQEVGLFLERGPVLHHGSLLKAKTGEIIEVLAADEAVTTAYIDNGLPLARLCYHLGNRHVPLAIGYDNTDDNDTNEGRYWVRFAPDHVLEELAQLLGATLTHHQAPFDPESGAYANTDKGKFLGHSHAQNHNHNHGHHHEH
ncbi:urease accessory protein UreE [Psychrobacter sp. 2Y5]|uniref:urease accessory protein UreE n=1 Tax=unclassified Psychrobacter TaxID=196806 RepID=UPI003F4772AD